MEPGCSGGRTNSPTLSQPSPAEHNLSLLATPLLPNVTHCNTTLWKTGLSRGDVEFSGEEVPKLLELLPLQLGVMQVLKPGSWMPKEVSEEGEGRRLVGMGSMPSWGSLTQTLRDTTDLFHPTRGNLAVFTNLLPSTYRFCLVPVKVHPLNFGILTAPHCAASHIEKVLAFQ